MEWTQFILMLIAISGMFFWSRNESRSDYKHMEARMESRQIALEAILNAIKDEMKDFHGRLCAIEERKRYRKE